MACPSARECSRIDVQHPFLYRLVPMGLPAKRRTKQSKRERAAHFALSATALTACPKCKTAIRPHRVCANCGYYKGRDVLKLKDRDARTAARTKKRESRASR